MSEELKPCPFCGGQGDYYYIMTMRKHWIGCSNCNCATDGYDTEEEAIEAWNTRAERTCNATYPNDSDYRTVPIPRCSECRRPIIEYEDGGLANYCHYCGAKVIN